MHTRTFVSILLFLGLQIQQGYAQHSVRQLDSTLQTIKAKITNLEQDRNSIQQVLDWDKDKPWRISFQQITTDSRGKSSTKTWEFNLANLDVNATRWTASGTKLTLSSRVERNQKLIRLLINNEQGPYEENIDVPFTEIEAVRSACDDLKKAIQIAKPLWEKSTALAASDLTGLMAVISNTIQEASTGKSLNYRQKLERSSTLPDVIDVQVDEQDSKGTTTLIYRFSIGDLNENGIKIVVSGSKLSLNMTTSGKRPFIEVISDGKTKSFTHEFDLYLADPEGAMLTQRAFSKMIPMASQVLKTRLLKYNTPNEALNALKPLITNTEKNKAPIEQSLNGTLDEMYSQTLTNSKGVKVSTISTFFWGDINEKNLNSSAQGAQLGLRLKTVEQQKFIQIQENNELQNYGNEFEFLFGDVESLRQAEHLIAQLRPMIKSEYPAQDQAWLQKTLGEISKNNSNLNQQLAGDESNTACQWILTRVESSDKGAKETKYQFSLKDIDPNQVNIVVRGKELWLELQSKFKQKVITRYIEGKAEYIYACAFQFANLSDLKLGRSTMLKLIEACK